MAPALGVQSALRLRGKPRSQHLMDTRASIAGGAIPAVTGRLASEPDRTGYARFAWGVLGYNLFVIAWGAFVRATGSGAGCGSHWPLCNGEIIPRSPALTTVIEFGHRATSGVALLLVAALVVGAWRRYPAGHIVRRWAVYSAVFLVVEALIGAGLVLLELVADNASLARGYWVGGHLINTFFLVGALTLTAWLASGHSTPRPRQYPALAWTFAIALGGIVILGSSGAITALGDTLFPAATLSEATAQTLSESAHLFVRLRIWHPVLAFAVFFLVLVAIWNAIGTGGSETATHLAAAVFALFVLQLVIGGLNVWLLAPVALQLTHLLLAHAIWIGTLLLAASVLTPAPEV